MAIILPACWGWVEALLKSEKNFCAARREI